MTDKLRSIIFNLVYYGSTAIFCVLYIPTVFLPEKMYIKALNFYFLYVAFIERVFMNLRYEVIGREHLPKEGSYIVAAKHYSAYETLKLYVLFDHPAVILKKELFSIPIWGWLAKKAGNIGIDRSDRDSAVQSIKQGAIDTAKEGRPIVIFPQGTRVGINVKKPYKRGITHMAKAADLPIIPLAMNSGVFWPRNAFWKKSGVVTFKFLPPIPKNIPADDIIRRLETDLEQESHALVESAKKL